MGSIFHIRCTIFTINARYSHVRNRHIMFITIEHIKNIGISKFENTKKLLVQVRNLFINFELKEERHNLAMLSYSSSPHLVRPPIGRKFACFGELAKVEPPRLVSSFQLSLTFFQFSTNLWALPVRDVTRTPSPVSSRIIVTSLSDIFVHPRAPALTPASMFAAN